jgi:hypothetical protein
MVELKANMRLPEVVFERTDEAALLGEIAQRLIEAAEIGGEARIQKWILRMACLFSTECPRSAWVYLRLCTGDLSAVTASHATIGAALHRSKQGEHKEHKQALRVIARHFPELAVAIAELERKTPIAPPQCPALP